MRDQLDFDVYNYDTKEKIDLRFHNLRHVCAIQWLRQGATLAFVKKQLGHTDIKTTMRYANILGVLPQEQVDKLGEIIRRECA